MGWWQGEAERRLARAVLLVYALRHEQNSDPIRPVLYSALKTLSAPLSPQIHVNHFRKLIRVRGVMCGQRDLMDPHKHEPGTVF